MQMLQSNLLHDMQTLQPISVCHAFLQPNYVPNMQLLQPKSVCGPLADMQVKKPNHLSDMQVLLHTPALYAVAAAALVCLI